MCENTELWFFFHYTSSFILKISSSCGFLCSSLTSLILSQPHYCVDWVHLCFYIPPPAVHLLCTFSFTLCPFSNCTYWIPLLNSSLLSLHFSPSTLRCNWRRRGRDMKGTRWGKRDSTKWASTARGSHFVEFVECRLNLASTRVFSWGEILSVRSLPSLCLVLVSSLWPYIIVTLWKIAIGDWDIAVIATICNDSHFLCSGCFKDGNQSALSLFGGLSWHLHAICLWQYDD